MHTHLAVAGFAGVGKTEVCRLLEQRIGFFRVSFGSEIEKIAVQRGLAKERQELMLLGKELVQEMGWDQFMSMFLRDAPANKPLLFDGVRDLAALDALRRILGTEKVQLVFLDAPASVRRGRMLLRNRDVDKSVDVDRFQLDEADQTELNLLFSRAELIVDASGRPEATLARIVSFLA